MSTRRNGKMNIRKSRNSMTLSGNVHISHSCDASYAEIKQTVCSEEFRLEHSDLFANRSTKSIVREWVVHNAMYRLGLFRSRTESVDINWPLPWLESIIYWIAYPIARLIIR